MRNDADCGFHMDNQKGVGHCKLIALCLWIGAVHGSKELC